MRKCYINNEEVLISKNWVIRDSIDSRNTFSFVVIDLLALNDLYVGALVEFEIIGQISNTLIFGGTIEKITEYEIGNGFIEYQISAVDYNSLADKRVVVDSVDNKNAGDIIRDSILPILAEEGITEGTIQDGPLITKAIFNYNTATECLDYLADVSGLVWDIDYNKELNYYARDTYFSPFDITPTTQHSRFSYQRNRNQYRNTQYIRAGRGKTSTQTLEKPTPKPDGVSRNFIVRYPLAEKPRIFIDTVEVDGNDIGINGVDTNKIFYYAIDSNIITQDENETVLTTEVIEITYVGLFPILVKTEVITEIDDRRTKEAGTSGIYERLDIEGNIDESIQAVEFAEGLIEKFGFIPSMIQFDTEIAGLKSGQLVTVNKPLYGINDQYLIESIDMGLIGNDIVYSVKALDAVGIGGWQNYFKNLLKSKKDFVVGRNESIILLSKEAESYTLKATNEIKIFESLYPAENLFPADNLFAGTLIGEVVLSG
jgi:hypothetical protein